MIVEDLNGLTVRLLERPDAHTVGAVLRVWSGAVDDPPGRDGTAHLLEHLNVAATARDLTRSGLSPLRGTTGNTATAYTGVCLPEDTPALAGALAAALQRPDPDERTLESERNAVIVEMRAAAARPLARLGPVIADAACPGRGLAAGLAADEHSVNEIGPPDLAGLWAGRYLPPYQAEIAIAGPALDRDRLLSGFARSPGTERRAATPAAAGAPGSGLPLAPELDGVTAVSLVRRRGDAGMVAALTGRRGALTALAAGHGRPLRGRSTVTGIGCRVEVLCWDAGSDLAAALARDLDRLTGTALGAVARESRAAAQTSAFRSHTPLGAAVSAIAEDPSLDISMPQRLTVWTVADRVPRRVAEHTVPSPEEGDSC